MALRTQMINIVLGIGVGVVLFAVFFWIVSKCRRYSSSCYAVAIRLVYFFALGLILTVVGILELIVGKQVEYFTTSGSTCGAWWAGVAAIVSGLFQQSYYLLNILNKWNEGGGIDEDEDGCAESEIIPFEWERFTDNSSGKPFWKHKVNGKTSWESPADMAARETKGRTGNLIDGEIDDDLVSIIKKARKAVKRKEVCPRGLLWHFDLDNPMMFFLFTGTATFMASLCGIFIEDSEKSLIDGYTYCSTVGSAESIHWHYEPVNDTRHLTPGYCYCKEKMLADVDIFTYHQLDGLNGTASSFTDCDSLQSDYTGLLSASTLWCAVIAAVSLAGLLMTRCLENPDNRGPQGPSEEWNKWSQTATNAFNSEAPTVDELHPGDAVLVQMKTRLGMGGAEGSEKGWVRWLGDVHYTATMVKTMVGVELVEPVGHNNGTMKGDFYFLCQPNHGMFVSLSQVRPTNLEFEHEGGGSGGGGGGGGGIYDSRGGERPQGFATTPKVVPLCGEEGGSNTGGGGGGDGERGVGRARSLKLAKRVPTSGAADGEGSGSGRSKSLKISKRHGEGSGRSRTRTSSGEYKPGNGGGLTREKSSRGLSSKERAERRAARGQQSFK
jgi:hypothetical protein